MVKATPAKVAAEMSPPNYRGAVQLIGTVKPKKEKIASLNGDIGGIWDRVEGYKVNKRAAKFWLTLDALDPQDRNDVIRSLEGLISASDWKDTADLLDDVGPDNVHHLRPRENTGAGGDDDDDDNGENNLDDDDQDDDDDNGENDRPDPLEAAKRHLGAAPVETTLGAVNKARGARGKPPIGDTYTGDNSDLAGDDTNH